MRSREELMRRAPTIMRRFGSYRALQGQNIDGALIEFVLHEVDAGIVGDDFLGFLNISL